MTNLTYFTVAGNWFDVEAPTTSGSTNTPAVNDINAFVTFTARLKPGTVAYVSNLDQTISGGTGQANTAVAIAPVTARILDGELSVINRADTPNVQLVANTPVLGLSAPLVYDVAFTNVTYAGSTQTLLNFAFTAPTAATTIDLTDPTLTRLPYDPTNYP
jgi:hypothetical protein